MRTLLIIMIWASLPPSVVAKTSDSESNGCYDRVLDDEIVGDTITIFGKDSSIITGIVPLYMQQSSIFVRSMNPQSSGESFSIPLANINAIKYSKPFHGTGTLAVLGLVTGVMAGAFIGVNNAPEPSGWFDMPELRSGIQGGAIGGIVGTALGVVIGNSIKFTTVKLQCK